MCLCACCSAGGNKNPLKRKAFQDVDQTKLEEALVKYCKHMGIHAAFDFRSYHSMTVSEAVDIGAMSKLLPLIFALLGSTES